MNYRVIDKEQYYRSGVFRHFTEDCKCSTSMTARIDVTDLVEHSGRTGTRFYINFLYVLSKVLNSRDDYKMGYLWQSEELICYDSINPIQYVFHEDTETCTPVYTVYAEDYEEFYRNAADDVENAKKSREYGLDMMNHPNWFDASYISWLSYDSLNIELPDGYLHFAPIINWGKYREENGRLMMPVSVRMNHAIADGFLVANVYRLLEKEMAVFIRNIIKIELLSETNFCLGSLDLYNRKQDVNKVYRKIDGEYVLVECRYTEDWDLNKKRSVAKKICSDAYITYLALENEKVVGFIGLLRKLSGPYMILDMMQVSSECRGQGIGRRLFEAGKAEAKKNGAQALYISACSSEETIAFYRAMGSELAGNPIKEIAEEEPFDLQMICPVNKERIIYE